VSDPGITVGLGQSGDGADAKASRLTAGLSMQARARVMVAISLLLAVPALLVGALRAERVVDDVDIFERTVQLAEDARSIELAAERARTAVFAWQADANEDRTRRLKGRLDAVAARIHDVEGRITKVLEEPVLADEILPWKGELGTEALVQTEQPLLRLSRALERARRGLGSSLDDGTGPDAKGARRAEEALGTLGRDAASLAAHARAFTLARAEASGRSASFVGRDQIVLFLLLLFCAPLLLGIAPTWMVAPVTRLRALAKRVETGRVREIVTDGSDEVAQLVRALSRSLGRLEQHDKKQRTKIFEMRRVLRSVLSGVRDAVLIVGRGGKVDYANPAAAVLLADEVHHLESRPLEEVVFSPELTAAVDKARTGDLDAGGVDLTIETADDRVEKLHAVLDSVRNSEGKVTRVVVVLQR
jgi:PAS domain-containing protein